MSDHHCTDTDGALQSLVDFAKARGLSSVDVTVRPDGRVTIGFSHPFNTVPHAEKLRTLYADLHPDVHGTRPSDLLRNTGCNCP